MSADLDAKFDEVNASLTETHTSIKSNGASLWILIVAVNDGGKC